MGRLNMAKLLEYINAEDTDFFKKMIVTNRAKENLGDKRDFRSVYNNAVGTLNIRWSIVNTDKHNQWTNRDKDTNKLTKEIIEYLLIIYPDDVNEIIESLKEVSLVKQSRPNTRWEKIGETEYYINCGPKEVGERIIAICKCLDKIGKISEYEFEYETKSSEEEIMSDIHKIVRGAIENGKKHQIIFTGAPGTGKTFGVRKYVYNQCTEKNEDGSIKIDSKTGDPIIDQDRYKFVQFHPSYDYSDFVEGLRPVVLKGNTEMSFVKLDGVFKAFCRRIEEDKIALKNKGEYFFIIDEINRADLSKVFGELMFGLEEDYRGRENRFPTQYSNLKTTYRILSKTDVEANSEYTPEDIGKAVPIDKDVFEDGFYIPEELYIIGTMNDIDRSVDSMDFALRRRFKWIEIKANVVMIESLNAMLNNDNDNEKNNLIRDDLAKRITNMNKNGISGENEFGLTDAYHIGPSYFKNLNYDNEEKSFNKSLENTFNTDIVSILKEYTRGRQDDKIRAFIKKCADQLGVEYIEEYIEEGN